MSYELWSNNAAHLNPNHLSNGCSLDIKCERITAKLAGWKKALYWKIASLGKANMYVVRDGDRIVHTSYVVRGRAKFVFMTKCDIEIGPCWTDDEYRGRGIFPSVLTRIIQNELKNDEAVAYMIIKDTNTPSQRGVVKAGFTRTGEFVETDWLKRYYKSNQKTVK